MFEVVLSIQNYSVVQENYRMILSITAFYIPSFLRSLAFQEILVFSFYCKEVEVFGLHQCELLLEL